MVESWNSHSEPINKATFSWLTLPAIVTLKGHHSPCTKKHPLSNNCPAGRFVQTHWRWAHLYLPQQVIGRRIYCRYYNIRLVYQYSDVFIYHIVDIEYIGIFWWQTWIVTGMNKCILKCSIPNKSNTSLKDIWLLPYWGWNISQLDVHCGGFDSQLYV